MKDLHHVHDIYFFAFCLVAIFSGRKTAGKCLKSHLNCVISPVNYSLTDFHCIFFYYECFYNSLDSSGNNCVEDRGWLVCEGFNKKFAWLSYSI